jgi:hypothetical protein
MKNQLEEMIRKKEETTSKQIATFSEMNADSLAYD